MHLNYPLASTEFTFGSHLVTGMATRTSALWFKRDNRMGDLMSEAKCWGGQLSFIIMEDGKFKLLR